MAVAINYLLELLDFKTMRHTIATCSKQILKILFKILHYHVLQVLLEKYLEILKIAIKEQDHYYLNSKSFYIKRKTRERFQAIVLNILQKQQR